MNLFKKALIAVLGLGLVVAPSTVDKVEEVEAAAGGTATLKLSSSIWGSASAYYSIHYWGGDTSTNWPGNKFNGGASAKGDVEITANYDETSTHCIIIRWSSSSYSTEWNRWDWFDSNTMTTPYNYFTNTAWDSCSSKYVASEVVKEEYTYTYYDGDTVLGTDTLVEGDSWGSKFYEKEGYEFKGWYTDSAFTTEYADGSTATANTNLYAKYVAAEDYKVYVDDNGSFGEEAYAYTYSSVDNRNNTWPGQAMTKEDNGLWSYTVDVSKSFDKIIFGNGQDEYINSVLNPSWAQTANLDLPGEETIFTLGAKDSSNKYTATVETASDIATEVNLKAYYQTNGTSVRVLSSLGVNGGTFTTDSLSSVGFVFEWNGKTKTQDSGYVYTTVVADGDTISAADDYGAQYFFVATFNNVPSEIEFTVTPYATLTNGYVYYGAAITVTVA